MSKKKLPKKKGDQWFCTEKQAQKQGLPREVVVLRKGGGKYVIYAK